MYYSTEHRVQSRAGASRVSIPPKTFIVLLFIVCRPIIGRDYFEEFHIHFISLFILSVLFSHTKKLSLYIWATLSKKEGRTLYKKEKPKKKINLVLSFLYLSACNLRRVTVLWLILIELFIFQWWWERRWGNSRRWIWWQVREETSRQGKKCGKSVSLEKQQSWK